MHFPLSSCKNLPLLFPWCICSIVYGLDAPGYMEDKSDEQLSRLL